MKSSLKKQAERFLREQKNYKRWLAVFVCLAVVVTIGTTAALKYKGIAVTSDDSATEAMHMEQTEEIPEGMRRHVHTEACYEEQLVLVCEEGKAEDSETADAGTVDTDASDAGASDTAADTGAAPEESKPAEVSQGHTHGDACYEVTGGTEKLTCTEEEHTHGDGCYETKMVTETVTKTVPETVTEEVTDEEGNVTTVEKTVDKTVEETVEKEEKVLTCAKEEHTHGASCYTAEGGERTLVCGKEEGEGAESAAVEAAPAEETAAPAAEAASAEIPAAESAAASAEVPAAENAEAAEVPAAAAETAAEETVAPAEAAETTTAAPVENAATETLAENAEETAVTEETAAEAAGTETTGAENTEAAEDAAGEHVHDESCYELQMVLICGKEEGELEEIPFEGGVQECVAGNVKVIAAYGPEAEIPANAVLQAKQITAEEDPEYYAEREAEYLKEAGEDAVLDMLLDIGFYVDGAEVEPKAPVSITIEMLDDVYEDGEELNVIHFGSEETEKLDASEIETNEEGNKTTSFETNSFSTFAIGKSSIEAADLVNGTEYLIYYQSGGTTWALSHKGDQLQATNVTVDSNGSLVTIPEGFEKKDFLWKYTVVDSGSKYLEYQTGSTRKRLMLSKGQWQLSDNEGSRLVFNTADNAIQIIRDNKGGDGYLCLENNKVVNKGKSDRNYTAWTFAKTISDKYTVRYWTNKNNVTKFKGAEAPSENELLAEIELPVLENGTIEIPIAGAVQYGNSEVAVGNLGDYALNNHTYKFYGWSFKYDANYQQFAEYNIYCGEQIKINDVVVPTYVSGGVISYDAADIKGDTIDLYATWAAPSQIEGNNGVKYYGSGATSPVADAKNGVMFFVRLDGTLPNEPVPENRVGEVNSAYYTDGVKAKDENNKDVLDPLYYWMHIYGNGNENAVEANLKYKPSDEDIYNAVRKAIVEGKKVYVAGKVITAEEIEKISADEFAKRYYVKWYVCKDSAQNNGKDCWHIDGVLLGKNKWTLVYSDPDLTIKNDFLIPERQYEYKGSESDTAKVNNTLVSNQDSPKEPTRPGFIFKDWNTKLDGSGTPFKAGDQITVDSAGDVYRLNGDEWERIDGLKAIDKDGVWEVILYPQWEKITHEYTIEKAWKDENSLINPLIKSIKVEISRYAVDENRNPLKKDDDGNPLKETLPIVTLESSKNWKTTVTLDDTDEDGNTYVYEMREVEIDGESGEIIEAKDSYIMDYNKTSNKLYTLTNILNEKKIVKVSVKKTKEDGTTPLSDAVFKLSRKEGDGRYTVISENYKSGTDGFAINEGALIAGEYKLEEVTAPAGYLKNNEVIEFKVEDEGAGGNPDMKITVTSQNSDEWNWNSNAKTFTLKNKEMTMAVKLKKVPSDNPGGGVLGGAEFVVKNTEGKYLTNVGTWSDTLEENCKFATDEEGENKGIAELPELPAGEYTLEEVKAPDGYNLRGGSIPFVIRLDGTQLKLDRKSGEMSGDTYTGVDINNDEKTIRVSNSAGIILPETGGPGTAAYTFGGLAMMIAVSLMYGLNMRRKREKGGLE